MHGYVNIVTDIQSLEVVLWSFQKKLHVLCIQATLFYGERFFVCYSSSTVDFQDGIFQSIVFPNASRQTFSSETVFVLIAGKHDAILFMTGRYTFEYLPWN